MTNPKKYARSLLGSRLRSLIIASKGDSFSLRGARVFGKLDLKHRVIDKAIDLAGCEFVGEVDLRYCEFEGAIDLSGCVFHETFNSGDEVESHTIYRKDLEAAPIGSSEFA